MQKNRKVHQTEINDPSLLNEIDFIQIKKASLILRAINHKLRQQILKLLENQSKLSVTEICLQVHLRQSVASQHLSILRRSGVVQTNREGKCIFYTLNYQKLEDKPPGSIPWFKID